MTSTRSSSGVPGYRGAVNSEHEGLRIAKLFRKHRVGVDVRACNLEQVCAEDDLELVEARHAEKSYTACLVCGPDGVGGLIALAPGQERGRKRFSIAHELGHYHIPWQKMTRAGGPCSDRDMRAAHHSLTQREREANDFATELLMPRKLFAEDARKRDVSIAAALQLGSPDYYDVSGMAAAWRIIQTTREPAAMVVSVGGRVVDGSLGSLSPSAHRARASTTRQHASRGGIPRQNQCRQTSRCGDRCLDGHPHRDERYSPREHALHPDAKSGRLGSLAHGHGSHGRRRLDERSELTSPSQEVTFVRVARRPGHADDVDARLRSADPR